MRLTRGRSTRALTRRWTGSMLAAGVVVGGLLIAATPAEGTPRRAGSVQTSRPGATPAPDDAAPPAPRISGLSGVDKKAGLSTDPDQFRGDVGATEERLTVTAPGAAGLAYAILPGGQVDFPVNLQCGTTTGGYTTVCSRSGAARTLTITAPSDISTFAAESLGPDGSVSTTSSVTFYALGDYAATGEGHSWPTGAARGRTGACTTGPVPDSAGGGQPELQYVSDHHACWEYSAVAPSDRGSPPSFGFDGDGVLYLDGHRSRSGTSTVVGPHDDVTVGAWVRPATDVPGDYVGAAISESVRGQTLFSLGAADGSYRFCVESVVGPAETESCATSAVGTVVSGTWTDLTGVYDVADGLLLLYVSPRSDFVSTPVIGSRPGVTPAGAPTALEIGNDHLPGSSPSYWNGEILDPYVIPGVVDAAQLSQLAGMTPPIDLTAPI